MRKFVRCFSLFVLCGILFFLPGISLDAGNLNNFEKFSFDHEACKKSGSINTSLINDNNRKIDTVLISDFSVGKGNEVPINWKVERCSQHSGSVMGSSCFRLLSSGNRFFPLLPKMSSYIIDLEFEYIFYGRNSNLLRLFYRYDKESQSGEFIEIIIEDHDHYRLLQGRLDGKKFSEREEVLRGELPDSKVRLIVNTNLESTSIIVNGQSTNIFATDYDIPSTVALEHGGAGMQDVCLQKFNIYTFDDIRESEIIPEVKIVFPSGMHGMDIPFTYGVSAIDRDGLTVIRVILSGSILEQERSGWFPYHERKIDWLTRPYIKILGNRYNLSDTTLVLSAYQREYFYQVLYEKPDWPLKREFILEEQIPERFVMSLGYDNYISETSQHVAGGPGEVVVDMPSGKILHQGNAVGNGDNKFDIQIESSTDKEIISLIPIQDPRYEQAVNFARNNHYFMESEPCQFTVNIFSEEANGLRVKYQIENAFFEPIFGPEQVIISNNKSDSICPGIVKQSFNVDAGPMETGVYHIRVKVLDGNKSISEDYRAFEVISRRENAPTPPLASGLPYMYNAPNEIMNLDNDYFDPWRGADGLNASHYISCSTFYPGVGREYKIWQTLKPYQRDWWLWVTTRTAEYSGIVPNENLIPYSDYLCVGSESSNIFYYPNYPFVINSYKGEMLNYLISFTRKLNLSKNSLLHPGNLRKEQKLSSEGMEELVKHYWGDWLDFYSKGAQEVLLDQQKLIKSINSSVKMSQYGPFAIYAGCYKMGWCLKYRGIDAGNKPEEVLDGFFQYEDYPVWCGYNIGRGPLTLASIKLVAPKLKMFPELYGRGAQGCPDGAVFRAHPPFGLIPNIPTSMYRKRILEYAYGAVWHNEDGFDYWRDYGFHCRNWTQEQFETFINTWKTVRDHKPVRPLRSTAYIYSEECCRQHKTLYPEIINTAEEDVAFAWEMSRTNGNAGGFVALLSSLGSLSSDDTDCLVLPPLSGATKSELSEIRRLHSEGVALIGFEDVTGLEDIFGVKLLPEPVTVSTIHVNTRLKDNPLSELGRLSETSSHPDCIAKYSDDGASVLLEGEAPVLFQYNNTTMFNVPPTLVNRSNVHLTGYGSESISQLINNSMSLITKELGNPTISSDEGRVLAFEDSKENIVVLIFSDFWPAEGRSINPKVTFNIRGLTTDSITCDHGYSIINFTDNQATVKLSLDENEIVKLIIKTKNNF
jgi:hypothetical protein